MARKTNREQIADLVNLMGAKSKGKTTNEVLDEMEEAWGSAHGGGGESYDVDHMSDSDWEDVFETEGGE